MRPQALEHGEYWAFDERAKALAAEEKASDQIVIVEIGDGDLAWVEKNVGIAWPWPRAVHAALVRFLSRGDPKVIGFDFLFEGPGADASDALQFAEAMRESGRVVIGMDMPRAAAAERLPPPPGRFATRVALLPTRQAAEESASLLAAWGARAFAFPEPGGIALWAGGLPDAAEVLGMRARLASKAGLEELLAGEPTEPRELTDRELGEEITVQRVLAEREALDAVIPLELNLEEHSLQAPYGPLAHAAALVANVKQSPDTDGILRRYELLARHQEHLWPSLAMALFLKGSPEVRPRFDGATLLLGERRLPLDERGQALIRWTPRLQYRHIPAQALLASEDDLQEGRTPRIDPASLRGKYVLVSPFAAAMKDVKASPVERVHFGAEINVTMLDNLLSGRVLRRTSPAQDALVAWLFGILAALLVVAVETAFTSTLLALGSGLVALLVLAGAGWAAASWILTAQGLWLPVVLPIGGGLLSASAAVLAASGLERQDRRFVQEALGRYTSPALVNELLAHPEYLSLEWGETREITVYFSDIAGFTSFSENLRPERLVRLLNEYLTEMTDIVLAHGGVVDKYIGDAIMAFWGAPLPEPEHAKRAVQAALAMRQRCEELRPRWKAEYGPEVVARAGINTGQAVAGNMGSKHKFNYTVMGDMVNLASRLEGANKPYGTVLMISETTYAQVQDVVEVRELDLLAVKGKQKPVTVYEVLALKGKLDPAMEQPLGWYREGLALYRAQKFSEALASFEKVLQARPDDGPSATYRNRSRHFLAEPPGAQWDGVWHMKEK
jgi:adenylate cyclase